MEATSTEVVECTKETNSNVRQVESCHLVDIAVFCYLCNLGWKKSVCSCNFCITLFVIYAERMKNISFRSDVLPLKNELYRLALRITLDSAEAEDVVQETMIKVWNRRDEWGRIDSMEAFCLAVCRNLALDKTRKRANQSSSLDGVSSTDTPDRSYTSNPEKRVIDRDRIALVRRLIDNLPEKQRTAMLLRDFEGRSYKEIASVMDISEQLVKVSIFRARQTVKKKLEETENYGL